MRFKTLWLVAAVLAGPARPATPENELIINSFMQLLIGDDAYAEQAFAVLEREWQPGFAAMSLDALSLGFDPARSSRLVALLEEKTGQSFSYNVTSWYDWLWNRPEALHPAYGDFKAALYSLVDPAFRAYFSSDRAATIRLDEIRWGGVRQDGIPPLRNPKMIAASEADYLDDGNVVFGLDVNGDVRAYPKRILAWHELFTDTIGGVPVAGVYCTLCGSMILYKSEDGERRFTLGTSGFLYRSNKLMYDRATQSLWSTLWGRPVVGPLVGKGIELESMSVVTTTWGEWRRRHPGTLVLSLETGYERDYSEGAAYRDYFATDRLMFTVPKLDSRLKNKDEVFVLMLAGFDPTPLAVASAYLGANPVYYDKLGDHEIVILTDASGAHRAYESGHTRFAGWDKDVTLVDTEGIRWTLTEDRLTSEDGDVLPRLPAHRAFWFGWYAAYPDTRLVH